MLGSDGGLRASRRSRLLGCVGMTYEQIRLTSMGPIDGAWIHLELDPGGWYLRIGHRHLAGRYGDCQSEYYGDLTLAEVMDVIDATLSTLGHAE